MKNPYRTLLCFATCLVATGISLTTLHASQSGISGIEPDRINGAAYDGGPLPGGQSSLTAKIQILLDRAAVSPGVIDGYGCVRMTNWDATELAHLVTNGIEVSFEE